MAKQWGNLDAHHRMPASATKAMRRRCTESSPATPTTTTATTSFAMVASPSRAIPISNILVHRQLTKCFQIKLLLLCSIHTRAWLIWQSLAVKSSAADFVEEGLSAVILDFFTCCWLIFLQLLGGLSKIEFLVVLCFPCFNSLEILASVACLEKGAAILVPVPVPVPVRLTFATALASSAFAIATLLAALS
eukprot:GGOE01020332.1.p2 GENE.GGOE01020332.1~~GGOE01020332.1.p2  ORF type:complete len:191 (-),score=17.26 GGOE01020332.1:545-1117(-)